jgi:hypothetical protein
VAAILSPSFSVGIMIETNSLRRDDVPADSFLVSSDSLGVAETALAMARVLPIAGTYGRHRRVVLNFVSSDMKIDMSLALKSQTKVKFESPKQISNFSGELVEGALAILAARRSFFRDEWPGNSNYSR